MQRPVQHQIDESAQRVFTAALPPAWVCRKHDPDYGIDYLVETVEADRLTGLNFAVQLKGKSSLKVSRGTVTFPLETHHLAYYVDRCRHPVFLVLVDVSRSEGHWLFLQRYALHDLAGTKWRSQKTVTVSIPSDQTLRKLQALCGAAQQAELFMTGLRPGAIGVAIDGERRRMESLDPRFRVVVRAAEGACSYELRAREPVEFKVAFKGDPTKVARMIDDLIGKGLPVQVTPEEVEVHGSALFAEAFSKPLSIEQVAAVTGTIRLTATGPDALPIATLDHVPATLRGGMTEARVEAHLPRTPIGLRLTLERWAEVPPPVPPLATFTLTPGEWSGQRLLQLAYFEEVARVFEPVCDGCGLRVEFLIDGNSVFALTAPPPLGQRFRNFATFCSVVRKAREVAAWGGVNPQFPGEWSEELVTEIERLHWMLTPGGRRRSGTGARITGECERSVLRRLMSEQQDEELTGCLRLDREDDPLPFMGEEMRVPRLRFVLTHARPEGGRAALRGQLWATESDLIQVRWVGTDQSEWIVERQEGPTVAARSGSSSV